MIILTPLPNDANTKLRTVRNPSIPMADILRIFILIFKSSS
jgi:hypothetical protein